MESILLNKNYSNEYIDDTFAPLQSPMLKGYGSLNGNKIVTENQLINSKVRKISKKNIVPVQHSTNFKSKYATIANIYFFNGVYFATETNKSNRAKYYIYRSENFIDWEAIELEYPIIHLHCADNIIYGYGIPVSPNYYYTTEDNGITWQLKETETMLYNSTKPLLFLEDSIYYLPRNSSTSDRVYKKYYKNTITEISLPGLGTNIRENINVILGFNKKDLVQITNLKTGGKIRIYDGFSAKPLQEYTINVIGEETSLFFENGNHRTNTNFAIGKSKIVILGYNKGAYTTDYINWTMFDLPISSSWQRVYFFENKFFALPYESNVALYSDDGFTWIPFLLPQATQNKTSSSFKEQENLFYKNGKLCYCCLENSKPLQYYETYDFINWQVNINFGFDQLYVNNSEKQIVETFSLIFDEGKYRIRYFPNTIYYSENYGKNWKIITFSTSLQHCSCFMLNKQFYLATYSGIYKINKENFSLDLYYSYPKNINYQKNFVFNNSILLYTTLGFTTTNSYGNYLIDKELNIIDLSNYFPITTERYFIIRFSNEFYIFFNTSKKIFKTKDFIHWEYYKDYSFLEFNEFVNSVLNVINNKMFYTLPGSAGYGKVYFTEDFETSIEIDFSSVIEDDVEELVCRKLFYLNNKYYFQIDEVLNEKKYLYSSENLVNFEQLTCLTKYQPYINLINNKFYRANTDYMSRCYNLFEYSYDGITWYDSEDWYLDDHDNILAINDHNPDSEFIINATLKANCWSDQYPYTQNIYSYDIGEETEGEIGLADTATDQERAAAREAILFKSSQGHECVTITADGSKPKIDIPIKITIKLKKGGLLYESIG